MLYILLCGFPPFYDNDNFKLFEKIKTGVFSFPEESWGSISAEVKDLLTKILVVDPKARLGPDAMLSHPWFSKDLTAGPKSSEMINQMREWRSKGAM